MHFSTLCRERLLALLGRPSEFAWTWILLHLYLLILEIFHGICHTACAEIVTTNWQDQKVEIGGYNPTIAALY